jgi:hypothetical protein
MMDRCQEKSKCQLAELTSELGVAAGRGTDQPREVPVEVGLVVEPDGDGDLRRRLKAAGPRRAAGFTWPATAAATWAAYRQALATAR